MSPPTQRNVPQEAGGRSPPLYANFPRRLDAMSLDTLVIVAFSILVLVVLLPLVQRLTAVRVAVAIGWWLALFLYEPIFVWRLGGTIGHRAMNLQVVDNGTEGPVSLPKALARFCLKALLGILSFFTMSFTRRHQAVHDILTNSSVRIRDAAKALPHHYTVGRFTGV